MQSYLKTRPVWIQLLLFMGMAVGIFMIATLIGTGILSQMTGIGMFEFAELAKKGDTSPEMLTYMRGMLLVQFLGLFVIPSLLFAYFSDPKPLDYIGLKQPVSALYWIIGAAAMLLAIPMVEYTGLLNRKIDFGSAQQWMQSMEDDAAKQIKFMLGKHTVGELLTNIIFISAFAGIGEELFFRGVLQRLFIKAFRNPWAGIVFTAIIFSALHVQFFGFIPRLLLGILLGAIYWYSGSLWTAILAHFVYDAFFIILSYFLPQLVESSEATFIDASMREILAVLSAALVLFFVWLMRKNSKASYDQVYRDDLPLNRQDFTF